LNEAQLSTRYPATPGLDNGLRLVTNPLDTSVRGTLFAGTKLILSVSSYYDASHAQKISHLSRDLTTGVVTAHALAPVGHTAGYMTLIDGPLGPALTGNFGLPIITRESYGPAAFIFDPQDLRKPAIPVLDYGSDHPLAPWNQQSDLWNGDSTFAGMIAVPGTRTLLFFGRHGTGPFCYGPPYGDPSVQPPNDPRCFTIPHETSDKGTHSDPYVYRLWAYDTNDLVAVKEGKTAPWQPRPYAVWNLDLPIASGWKQHNAAAFDPATKRLFILQGFGDKDPAQGWPVVHIYQVGVQ
jgi:hypothetical protein